MKEYKSLDNLTTITHLSAFLLALAHSLYCIIFYILDYEIAMYFKLTEASIAWIFLVFTYFFKCNLNFVIYFVRASLLFSCSVCNYLFGLDYGFLVIIILILSTGYVHNFQNPQTPKVLAFLEALVPCLVALLSYYVPTYKSNYMDFLNILGISLVAGCVFLYAFLTEQVNNYQQRTFEKQQAKLRKNIENDSLTGLYNRTTMNRIILSTLEVYAKTPEAEFSVALIDIDHFKTTNEQYGYKFGDLALENIARIIKAHTEPYTGNIYASRWSGQEFLISSLNCPEFSQVLEQIRNSVQNFTHTDGYHSGSLTISIGACRCTKNKGLDVILNRADSAIYKAKRAGGNKIVYVNLTKDSA